MTNNQLCDFIGMIGFGISFLCFLLCFFGFGAWIGAVIGVILMGISQVNYD